MELTREEAIGLHRKMWRWIAEETEKQKRIVTRKEYFKSMEIEEENIPEFYCYCCEYCELADGDCELCPILWDGEKTTCFSDFVTWLSTTSWQEAAELARKIAELPERKENKEYE